MSGEPTPDDPVRAAFRRGWKAGYEDAGNEVTQLRARIAELEAMIRADAPGQGTVDYTGGHR